MFLFKNVRHNDADGNTTYFVEFMGETWSYSSPASWLSHPFPLPVCWHNAPAIHPSIQAFLLGFLSVRKLQYSPQTLSLSLILSVTCRPGKLLALILYLSAVATVSGFPAPTNSFISDLQRKTWETLSHAHTHDSTPAHKKVHHSCTTPPDMVPHTHIHRAGFMCAVYFWHQQVQLCTGVHMVSRQYIQTRVQRWDTHSVLYKHTHSHRLSASRNCDDDEWFSSKDWDRTRIFFITWRCTA